MAKITSIAALRRAAEKTEIVALNGWDGEPFVCRLRRTTLRGMITAGKIPNPLLGAAQKLYEGAGSRANANIRDMLRVMELVVEDALVEPRYCELKDAGIDLTEEQFGAIFAYAQKGVQAIEPFLFRGGSDPVDAGGHALEDAAQRADGA